MVRKVDSEFYKVHLRIKAKTCVDREIPPDLPVILHKQTGVKLAILFERGDCRIVRQIDRLSLFKCWLVLL